MLKVLRPFFARLLDPVAHALARTPITPNAITITGTVGVAAGALWLFPTGHLFAGTLVCWFFVMADMLDGALARVKGTTGVFGAFLDSTLDRVADASVFGGLAAYFVFGGHSRLLAGVAVYCLVSGALVSYAKARAEGLGLRCDVGLAERTERLIIALVAAGLAGLGVPYVLSAGLWLLAAASTFTFGQRVLAVRKAAAAAADLGTDRAAGPAAGSAGSGTPGVSSAGSGPAGAGPVAGSAGAAAAGGTGTESGGGEWPD
jgi:CDP-diacylglycerol--glycerol-3-phosphate 3-phosphatidyltransferase